MKVLFLSHCPHEVHLEFAKSLNSRIKIIPLNWLVVLTKKISFLGYFYPVFSLICSFFIRVKENILLVDGGSSLYTAIFLKMRYPKVKIIYIDADMFFYSYNSYKKDLLTKTFQSFFFMKMDGIISISKQNKKYIPKFLKVPIEIVNPYPKKVKKNNINRKNFGLYIGRLDPDKNIKRIVKFALQCPYFEKFIIVGDGACRDYVKKISSLNKKIIYVGEKSDISNFYNKCKFFIHLPDYDPYCCTVMEAAICGCYPIMSKNIGASCLFNKIFIAEDPTNFVEINKKVIYMLKNETNVKLLLKKSLKKFPNKEKSIRKFKQAFNKIIK